MKKLFTLLTMLVIGIGSMWGQTTDFVSVVTAIDASTNLPSGAKSGSTTLQDGTIMSYGLADGKMWGSNSCSTAWSNSDAVLEINSILGKNIAASVYFPTNNANRCGAGAYKVTCTANLSNTSSYNVDKYVTFYVALSSASNSSKSLTVSGFSSADCSYALAGGTGFTRVNAINDIPCPANNYTLVKIRGKLNNSKTATVTFQTGGKSGVQWMAVKYNEETYTVTGDSENLSDVSNYSSYSSFNVPTGKTLNVDVADYKLDLLNVSGGGTININNAVTKTSSVSSEFTGTLNVNNSSSNITIQGYLGACTIKKTNGTLTYTGTNLNGTTLDGVILGGSERITTSGIVNIKNLAGNNISGNNGYAFVGSGTLNFEGTCDLTHKADGTTTNDNAKIGYGSANTINIKENATVTANQIMNSTSNDDNAPVNVASGATLTTTSNIRSNSLTNNGAINATRLYGAVTLADGSVTTLSNGTPLNQATSLTGTTITGDATLNVTATTVTLNQPIIVAEGKTLTIDGNNNAIVLTGTVTNNGIINIENATIEGGATRDFSTLPFADYDNCTLIVTETTAEFNTDNEVINITNIPNYFTTIKLRRADRRYVTLDVTDGSATFTDSEAKVSGPKCLYDFTFSLETLAERKSENSSTILNSGSRGSSNGLTYDNGYNSNNSYNNETGLLKVKSTPYRHMTGDNAWPDNYSVAVYANVPDVENGCLMAFGSSTNGGNKYLALIRGASSNEIKLVKGNGMNNAFEVIATMSAENATVAKHLVVFTKSGSTFKVYCDGVNVATTTYDQTLGTGFQIGSVHGGVTGTGIIRINDDLVSSEVKDAVEIQSIRIFDGVLTDDQMSALMKEFPYVSKGGSYSRTISADANLGEDNSWAKKDGENTYHIPTPVVEEASTYYPDVTVKTSADATLTVNEDVTFGKTSFGGSGTLTIAANEGYSLNIGGAVIINSDVVVKFGAMDMSTSPVTKGEYANLTFDFSDFNFNKVYTTTKFQITGLIGQDDTHINAIGLPTDPTGTRTYNFAYDDNHYWLTVTVRAPQDVYAPAGTTSITDNMPVKLTAEAATNNGLLIQDDNLVFVEDATVQFNQTPDFCGIKVQEGANVTVDANGSPMKIVSGTVIAQNGTTIGAVTGSGTLSVPAETSITVASVATGTTLEGAGNVTMTAFTRSMNPTLTNWEGTIAIENTNVGGAFVIDNLVNESNSLVKMTHIQGWIDANSTTAANIVLDNGDRTYGFNVTGVNTGASYTFTGDISGTGDFMYRQSDSESRNATFNFSGDLSEWTGKFNLNENGTGTTTVKVTSTDNINAGFANTATKANTLMVTFDSDEAQSVNGEVSNSGSGSLNLKLIGNGAKTIAANINASRLKIVRSTDAAVTISGTPTISVGRLSVYEDDDENTQTSLDIIMSRDDIIAKIGSNASCALIDVADGGAVNATGFTINGAEMVPIGDYAYYINHDESTNDIVLVKHYTRNVTSGNFGSICLPNGASVSQMTGVAKVLKVTKITTDRVVMDEVDEMVAGVPYIFKSNATTINLTLEGANVDEPTNDPEGYLVGNFAVADVPNSTSSQINYILQSNQFKKVTSDKIKSGKNRCYLKVSGESSRMSTLGIAVDEGGATGIDAINSLMNNDAEIYDLNGRRLNDLRKGINIVNGVKVIVK